MKRSIFAALTMSALMVVGGSSVFAQQKQGEKPQATVTCEDLVAKQLTPEQYKQLPSDEARKQYDDQLKQCKEGIAANAKAKNANEVVNRVIKEGASALEGKNYDVAIVKFEEGYNADPEYWGTAPVMLRNKAIALRARGVDRFNTAAKAKDQAGKDAAKKDFQDSVAALDTAVAIFAKTTPPTDATQAKNFENNKFTALGDRAESYRLLVIADSSKAADALKAFQEYIAVETDPAKKSKAQFTAADMAMKSGEVDLAVGEFQKIVDSDPSNSKAVYNLGIALIAQAANQNNDKAKIQEGVNYLQRFVDTAPDTDNDKAYAKATIDAMKAENNIAPQKGATRAGGKRKS